MPSNEGKPIRIESIPEQPRQIELATGEDSRTLDVSAAEREQRSVPLIYCKID